MELEYAQGWKPEEGATLIGAVTAIDSGWSEYRGNYPIITVKPEGAENVEEVAVHCFHDALYNRMMSLRPQIGERIGIQYKGKRPSKSNPRNTVAVYVVRVDRQAGADAWANLPGLQAPQPQAQPRPQPQAELPVDTSDFTPPTDATDDDDIPF